MDRNSFVEEYKRLCAINKPYEAMELLAFWLQDFPRLHGITLVNQYQKNQRELPQEFDWYRKRVFEELLHSFKGGKDAESLRVLPTKIKE